MPTVPGNLQTFRDKAWERIADPLAIHARLSKERGLAWSQLMKDAQIVRLLISSPASG